MHELSLCNNIIKIISERVSAAELSRINKIMIELGMLVCVDKAALEFGFSVLTKNTALRNAKLYFIDIKAQARCQNCQQITAISQRYDVCQTCQLYDLDILQGEEFQIKEIEVTDV